MNRSIRWCALTAVGCATALGAGACSPSWNESVWHRYQHTDDISDDLVVITQDSRFASLAMTASDVSLILEAVLDDGPRAVFVVGIAPGSSFADRTRLELLQRSSALTPVTEPVERLDDHPGSLPTATMAGGVTPGAGGLAFETPDGVGSTRPLAALNSDGAAIPSAALLGYIRLRSPTASLRLDGDHLVVGDERVPVESGGRLRVSTSASLEDASDPHRLYPNAVIQRGVSPEQVRDKIVLIGSDMSTSTVTDPVDGDRMSAVLVEGNVLNTLLTGAYTEPIGGPLSWLLPLVAAAVLAFVIVRLPAWAGPLGWVALMGGLGLAVEVLGRNGSLVGPFPTAAALSVIFVGGSGETAWRELVERRRVRGLFSQYVPPAVVDGLLASGRSERAAAGERLPVSLLFCDLRGFTPLAATLDAGLVRELLDVYYDVLSAATLDHHGTVLQYTGDEIFAVFGAPMPTPRHADDATACAADFLRLRGELNERLLERGLPGVEYGIGLHTGEVVAAHVGSTLRRQYSVIGENVNFASRVCSTARAGEVLASDSTHEACSSGWAWESVDDVTLKGISTPQRLWRLGPKSLGADSSGAGS